MQDSRLSSNNIKEPITRSFQLPYSPSELTLSRIFLYLEATPGARGFAGVVKIANHKRAIVFYCYTQHAGHTKVFQLSLAKKRGKLIIFFFKDVMQTLGCFRGN